MDNPIVNGASKTTGLVVDVVNTSLQSANEITKEAGKLTAGTLASARQVTQSIGNTAESVGQMAQHTSKLAGDVGEATGQMAQHTSKLAGTALDVTGQLTTNTGSVTSAALRNTESALDMANQHTKSVSDIAGSILSGTGKVVGTTLTATGDALEAGVNTAKRLSNAMTTSISTQIEKSTEATTIANELTGNLDNVKPRMKEKFGKIISELKSAELIRVQQVTKLYHSGCTGRVIKSCSLSDKTLYDPYIKYTEKVKSQIENLRGSVNLEITNSSTKEEIKDAYLKGQKKINALSNTSDDKFTEVLDKLGTVGGNRTQKKRFRKQTQKKRFRKKRPTTKRTRR